MSGVPETVRIGIRRSGTGTVQAVSSLETLSGLPWEFWSSRQGAMPAQSGRCHRRLTRTPGATPDTRNRASSSASAPPDGSTPHSCPVVASSPPPAHRRPSGSEPAWASQAVSQAYLAGDDSRIGGTHDMPDARQRMVVTTKAQYNTRSTTPRQR